MSQFSCPRQRSWPPVFAVAVNDSILFKNSNANRAWVNSCSKVEMKLFGFFLFMKNASNRYPQKPQEKGECNRSKLALFASDCHVTTSRTGSKQTNNNAVGHFRKFTTRAAMMAIFCINGSCLGSESQLVCLWKRLSPLVFSSWFQAVNALFFLCSKFSRSRFRIMTKHRTNNTPDDCLNKD